MHIHFYLLPFIIISGLLLINQGEKGRKKYIIINSLLLMLIVALRHEEKGFHEGSDVTNYYMMFENIKDCTWAELWQLIAVSFGTSEDAGFLLLQKAISCITSDFHVYSFIASLLFFIPFSLFLYRYSSNTKQLMFAFVFLTVMYFSHLMSGARQVFAVGLVWLALLLFLEKKYPWTLLCVALASTIHFSSIIILLPMAGILFVSNCKLLKTVHLVTLLLVPFVMFGANRIIVFMGNFIGSEKYAEYGMNALMGGTETFITMMTLLSIFCFVAIKEKHLQKDDFLRKIYVMLPCLTFFAPLIYSNGSMIRISEYFHLFLVLLIPFAIERFANKTKINMYYTLFIGVLSIWCLMGGGGNYYFFWQ